MRSGYETNETTITPAATKEQVAAAELWFKLNGKLKNDSKEVEEQKIRKLEAEADVAEQKARDARIGGKDVGKQFDKMFERLKEDSDK